MMRSLPFSQACENNKLAILTVIQPLFQAGETVLEIGSGTGQHSVYFAKQLPHIFWQPSDIAANLPIISAWQHQQPTNNNLTPLMLAIDEPWPSIHCDHIFTANTFHIISWQQVKQLITGAASKLNAGAYLVVYGPFNYNHQFTSQSNQQFDEMLRERDPLSGLRDFTQVNEIAQLKGFECMQDNTMPANNRCLVFRRQ